MKVTAVVLAAVAITAVAAAAHAQTRPDFSGRWVDSAAAASRGGAAGRAAPGGGAARGGDAAARGATGRAGRGAAIQGRGAGAAGGGGRGNLGTGWGPDITLLQEGNRLTLRYEIFVSGDMQPPIIYHYSLDGGETKNRLLLGWGVEERVSRTRWDGERFIITTVFTPSDPASGAPATFETTHVLSLASPTTLVIETTWPAAMGGNATTTRSVYTKM